MQLRVWRRRFGIVLFLVLLGLLVFTLLRPYAILDWLRMYGYQPPQAIKALAEVTSMTAEAKHYFFLNKPAVEDKPTFQSKCPKYDDQTITIGCYIGGQRGIYILSVEDQRLAGVEEVTAAHEMLHAAYERLGGKEKQRIDMLLEDYANSGLQDTRIKESLEGYKKSEPGQELNEMHSIFGTEIAELPAELNEYYSQYFGNRQQVVAFAQSYQEAFQSRQDQIDTYDAQLEQLSSSIKTNTQSLDDQSKAIERERQRLDGLRQSNSIEAYNAGVEPFNNSIATYNELLSKTRGLVREYNTLVEVRNAIAAQKVELQTAIDSSSLPASQ